MKYEIAVDATKLVIAVDTTGVPQSHVEDLRATIVRLLAIHRQFADRCVPGVSVDTGSGEASDIAAQIATLLNEMRDADPIATQKLITTRVRCNGELAQHPTVQVGRLDGFTTVYEVGLLGVLNGLCPESRRVVAVVEDVTMNLPRFETRDRTDSSR